MKVTLPIVQCSNSSSPSTSQQSENNNQQVTESNVEWECQMENTELSAIESDVCEYITGSVVRKVTASKKKFGLCQKCVELILTSKSSMTNKGNSLISLKEFKEGALIRASPPVVHLFKQFELHFQDRTEDGLPMPNPRESILNSFVKNIPTLVSLSCSNNHSSLLLQSILTLYCNIRIFHVVKLFNLNLEGEKRIIA